MSVPTWNNYIFTIKKDIKEIEDPYFMFNVAVFPFCVLSDNHKIYIIVSRKNKSYKEILI